MNLAKLRQQIFDQMDYQPSLANYKKSIDRRLNNHYQEICSLVNWLFMQKITTMNLKKKVVADSGSTPTVYVRVDNVTSFANIRKVYCFGFTPTLEMEGQTFTSTTSGKSYRIIRVVSSHFYIDANWDPAGGAADNATNIVGWEIVFDRFALPSDCIEPLSFVSETDDWGEIVFISKAKADTLYLDKDSTGKPLVVVDDQFLFDNPPIDTFTISNAGTSTGFTSGDQYEYCYTIYREGRESPPSKSVTFTIPSTLSGITLSNLENTGYWESTGSSSKLASGMDKLIYRRNITKNGRWTLVGSAPSTDTTFVDPAVNRQSDFSYQNNANFRFSNTTERIRFDEQVSRQNVSFWYIPDEDKEITFRYHFRPKDLEADTDVPVIPREFHQVLVYLTLHDMFMQSENINLAKLWEGRAREIINRMRTRYLKRDAQEIRFGRFDVLHRNWRRYSDPIWNG